jgi:hypothetical protein
MESWIQDVEYVLMPAHSPMKDYEHRYYTAYEIWKCAWKKFRGEIGVQDALFSDGFLVAHEIGVIFYKGECVGLSAFTHGTLKEGPLADHSWWKAWTPEAISLLRGISNDIVICSQFTVNPKFAGKDQVVRWKEIVSLYSLLRYQHSDAGVMAGHLNLTRGMQNASGEGSGATVLNECHPFNFYGVEINAQLVAYERSKVAKMIEKKNLNPLCDELWSKLIHISDFPAEKIVLPFRKAA